MKFNLHWTLEWKAVNSENWFLQQIATLTSSHVRTNPVIVISSFFIKFTCTTRCPTAATTHVPARSGRTRIAGFLRDFLFIFRVSGREITHGSVWKPVLDRENGVFKDLKSPIAQVETQRWRRIFGNNPRHEKSPNLNGNPNHNPHRSLRILHLRSLSDHSAHLTLLRRRLTGYCFTQTGGGRDREREREKLAGDGESRIWCGWLWRGIDRVGPKEEWFMVAR